MKNTLDAIDFSPAKGFFVGIDSDGCVFDSMAVKHHTCFAPAFIEVFNLSHCRREAEEVWEHVNLFSETRGCNRFMALEKSLRLLGERVSDVPQLPELTKWIQRTDCLSQQYLADECRQHPDNTLQMVLEWSQRVNERLEYMPAPATPFHHVADCLATIAQFADITVISQTPRAIIAAEWNRLKLDGYIDFIAGQEYGSKVRQLHLCIDGNYDRKHTMLLGDAPGDLEAAEANTALFYPIVPGHEQESWFYLKETAIAVFRNAHYGGSFQEQILADARRNFFNTPRWMRKN